MASYAEAQRLSKSQSDLQAQIESCKAQHEKEKETIFNSYEQELADINQKVKDLNILNIILEAQVANKDQEVIMNKEKLSK